MSLTTSDSSIIIECDYYGNILFLHKNNYYYLELDIDNKLGGQLFKLKNIDYYKRNLVLCKDMIDTVETGKINLTEMTLKGTVQNKINNMSDEMIEEIKEKNNFFNFDDTFEESKYYYITKDLSDTESIDSYDEETSNENNTFIFNDVCFDKTNDNKINISELLLNGPSIHDTIYIDGNQESKIVTSTIEHNQFCSTRIILFSKNILKINFIGTKTFTNQIIINNNELSIISYD
jgi:hypothetical protein